MEAVVVERRQNVDDGQQYGGDHRGRHGCLSAAAATAQRLGRRQTSHPSPSSQPVAEAVANIDSSVGSSSSFLYLL